MSYHSPTRIGTAAESFHFSAQQRLLCKNDYNAVFNCANKQRYSAKNMFTLLAMPTSSNQSRLGLIVPKKWHKTAVQRNRIKRVVRETFRQLPVKSLQSMPQQDIVFLSKSKFDPYSSTFSGAIKKGLGQLLGANK